MKKFALYLLVCLMLCATVLPQGMILAEEDNWVYSDYLTDEVENTVDWSGTWGTQGNTALNNPGTNLFNGLTNDKWGSFDICVSGNEWVSVNFSEKVKVSGWTVYQEQSLAYTNIIKYAAQIKESADGEWKTIYTSEELNEFWAKDTVTLPSQEECYSWRIYIEKDWARPGKVGSGSDTSYAVELAEIELKGYKEKKGGDSDDANTVLAALTEAAALIKVKTDSFDFKNEVDYALYDTSLTEYFGITETDKNMILEDTKGAYADITSYLDIHTLYEDEITEAYEFGVTMRVVDIESITADTQFMGVFARTLPANAFVKQVGDTENYINFTLFEYDYYNNYGGEKTGSIGPAGFCIVPVFYKGAITFMIDMKQYSEKSLNITHETYTFKALPDEMKESLTADGYFTVKFVDNGKDNTYVFINDILLCVLEYSGTPVVYDTEESEDYTYYPNAKVISYHGDEVYTFENTRVVANSWICGIGVRGPKVQIASLKYGKGLLSSTATAAPATAATPKVDPTSAPATSVPATKSPVAAETSSDTGDSNTVVIIAVVAVVVIAVIVVILLIVKKNKKG